MAMGEMIAAERTARTKAMTEMRAHIDSEVQREVI
jgi:hypothetical protein